MCTTDISLIKDVSNPVLAQRVQPPPTAILAHFKGPTIKAEHIKRPDITVVVDMGEKRAKIENSTTYKEVNTTYTPFLTSTFELDEISTLLPRPIITGLIGMLCEFFQFMVDR